MISGENPTKNHQARVAEWFKATDLRPVIYDAWVRTPPRAKQPRKNERPI